MKADDIRFSRAFQPLEDAAMDEYCSEYEGLIRELIASAPVEFRARFLQIAISSGHLPLPVAVNVDGWPLWKASDIAKLYQMTTVELQQKQPPFFVVTSEITI